MIKYSDITEYCEFFAVRPLRKSNQNQLKMLHRNVFRKYVHEILI